MMLPIDLRKQYQLPNWKYNCAENCMKKIWANFTTFNYNIGYLRKGQTFMYFQIEKFWHFNNKTKFRVKQNHYKKLFVMQCLRKPPDGDRTGQKLQRSDCMQFVVWPNVWYRCTVSVIINWICTFIIQWQDKCNVKTIFHVL